MPKPNTALKSDDIRSKAGRRIAEAGRAASASRSPESRQSENGPVSVRSGPAELRPHVGHSQLLSLTLKADTPQPKTDKLGLKLECAIVQASKTGDCSKC